MSKNVLVRSDRLSWMDIVARSEHARPSRTLEHVVQTAVGKIHMMYLKGTVKGRIRFHKLIL